MFILRCLRSFLFSHTTQIHDLLGPSWAHHGKRQSLKIYNFKSIWPLQLLERLSAGLPNHSVHLHAVWAKSRIKDTANIVHIIMTGLKIWLEWIKSLSNPNSRKMKDMAENKCSFSVKTIQLKFFLRNQTYLCIQNHLPCMWVYKSSCMSPEY